MNNDGNKMNYNWLLGHLGPDAPLSPYSSKICSLFFQGNGPLYIHRQLLDASPKLFDNKRERIDFEHIDINAGHVLVHFLLTGSYQYMRLEKPNQIKGLGEFSTALRVCWAAKDLQLPALLNLAKEQLEMNGSGLELTSIMQESEALSPSPVTVPEVANYILSRVEDIIRRPTMDAMSKLLAELGQPKTTSEVILKCFIDSQMIRERAEEEKLPDEPLVTRAPDPKLTDGEDRQTEECVDEDCAAEEPAAAEEEELKPAEDDYTDLQKSPVEDASKATENYVGNPSPEQYPNGPIGNEGMVLASLTKMSKKEKKMKKKMLKKAKVAGQMENPPNTPPLVGRNEGSQESESISEQGESRNRAKVDSMNMDFNHNFCLQVSCEALTSPSA